MPNKNFAKIITKLKTPRKILERVAVQPKKISYWKHRSASKFVVQVRPDLHPAGSVQRREGQTTVPTHSEPVHDSWAEPADRVEQPGCRKLRDIPIWKSGAHANENLSENRLLIPSSSKFFSYSLERNGDHFEREDESVHQLRAWVLQPRSYQRGSRRAESQLHPDEASRSVEKSYHIVITLKNESWVYIIKNKKNSKKRQHNGIFKFYLTSH